MASISSSKKTLGNDLAGGRVSVLPVVSEVAVCDQQTENLADEFPGIFPACVVTRAQARKAESEKEIMKVRFPLVTHFLEDCLMLGQLVF